MFLKRRTLATLMQSSGASVTDDARTSSAVMTLPTHAKVVTVDKRIAQDGTAAMFVKKARNNNCSCLTDKNRLLDSN